MATTLAQVEAEALRLSSEERAQLAHRLLRSLEPSPQAEIDRLWIEESERRHRDILAGAETIPATEAIARARASLR